MSNYVCRSCYRPAPARTKPGRGFVCVCHWLMQAEARRRRKSEE
jgi:hypothetical protein